MGMVTPQQAQQIRKFLRGKSEPIPMDNSPLSQALHKVHLLQLVPANYHLH